MVGQTVGARLKRWWPAIRIVASVVMLAVLVRHIPSVKSVIPVWRASTVGWLVGELAFTVLAIVLSAVRWQRVLAAIDLPARLGPLVNAALAGQFVSNFLPTTIGGDALRVTRLSAANGETPGTFASVVLDRMSGWLILPILCLAGLVINPALFELGRASTAAVVISVATLASLVGVLALAASPRLGRRLAGQATWQRFIGAVHLGLDRLRRRPTAAAGVLLTGFVYQLALVVGAILGARALGIHVGPTALLAFIPAVAIVQVLPFPTVGGLGVREGALIVFLTPLGVPTYQAIALGLLVYLMHLVASLIGAPAFAFGDRATRAAQATKAGPAARAVA